MLDTLAVNSSYEGWLVFNVSLAMETWMADNTTNQGLYIEAHSITGIINLLIGNFFLLCSHHNPFYNITLDQQKVKCKSYFSLVNNA